MNNHLLENKKNTEMNGRSFISGLVAKGQLLTLDSHFSFSFLTFFFVVCDPDLATELDGSIGDYNSSPA